jgi:hypothetical protein
MDTLNIPVIYQNVHVGINSEVLFDLIQTETLDPEAALRVREQGLVHLPTLAAMNGGKVPLTFEQRSGRYYTQSPFPLQSLPSAWRGAVTVSKPDYTLIYADWKACHWQILAYGSKDAQLIADVESGDLYDLFRPKKVTEEEMSRKACKVCSCAYLNGGGVPAFTKALDGNLTLAKTVKGHIATLLNTRWPAALAKLKELRQLAVESGWTDKQYGAAGVALQYADAQKMVKVLSDEGRENLGIEVVLPMHDGVLLQCPSEDVDEAVEWVKHTMTKIITKNEERAEKHSDVHVDVEVCGSSWKGDNPALIGDDLRVRANTGITEHDNPAGLMLAAAVHHSALKAEKKGHHGNSKVGKALNRALTNSANARQWLKGVERRKQQQSSGDSNLPALTRRTNDDGSEGDIENSLSNLQRVLRGDPTLNLRFNDWDLMVYNGDDQIDFNTWFASFSLRLETAYGWKPGFASKTLDAHTVLVAKEKSFHPLKEYVLDLEWDGVNRVDDWLKMAVYGKIKNSLLPHDDPAAYEEALYEMVSKDEIQLTGIYGKQFLIAMMARLFAPGPSCKVDTILVLAGIQGVGKQNCWRALAGDEYYAGTTLSGDRKESAQQMLHAWIYEDQEMASGSAAKEEQKKAFLSDSTDLVRLPYGRAAQRVDRHCVMAGSTNTPERLLKDPTGSRRYNVVKVPKFAHLPDHHPDQPRIDVEYIRENRDQLLAEAYLLYTKGEKWWIDREDPLFSLRAEVNQQKFQSDDPLACHARQVFRKNGGGKDNKITTIDFAQDYDPEIKSKDIVRTRLGHAVTESLKAAGFQTYRTGKGRFWYKPIPYGTTPIPGRDGLTGVSSTGGGSWGAFRDL